ncbi:unnamed protein product, partial [Polarella glacialis]
QQLFSHSATVVSSNGAPTRSLSGGPDQRRIHNFGGSQNPLPAYTGYPSVRVGSGAPSRGRSPPQREASGQLQPQGGLVQFSVPRFQAAVPAAATSPPPQGKSPAPPNPGFRHAPQLAVTHSTNSCSSVKQPSSPGVRHRLKATGEAEIQPQRPQLRQVVQPGSVVNGRFPVHPAASRHARPSACGSTSACRDLAATPSSPSAAPSVATRRVALTTEINGAAQDPASAIAAAIAAASDRGAFVEDSAILLNCSQPYQAPQVQAESISRLVHFWQQALSSSSTAAEYAAPGRVDSAMFWENRRLQNNLRRLLEELHERLCPSESRELQASEIGGLAFDSLLRHAESLGHPVVRSTGAGLEAELPEHVVSDLLQVFSLWPPELTNLDRQEVVASFQVPSLHSAKCLLRGKQIFGTNISRRAFCDALEQVPFNLPDFPVPAHLLSWSVQPNPQPEHRLAVAQAVATIFCLPHTGLFRVKDFFVSGLISVEEIQRALPRLVPQTLVEDAIARIIRRAAPLFSQEEWRELVVVPRK